jgi:hypothetical protein
MGYTSSIDFPTQNPLQPEFAGGSLDAFVTKFNAAGSALVYSTYLGGSGYEPFYISGIALDSAGNAYVTGMTTSTDFPTQNPLQPALRGEQDVLITKLNAGGSALVYSTYLGGGKNEEGHSIAVDSAGNAYVTGSTQSSDFPTTDFSLPRSKSSDAFVTKVNAAGNALVYSTFLGGSGSDSGNGIAVDAAGNAYVAGATLSTNFPTAKALDSALGGTTDAFVAKIPSPSVRLSGVKRNFPVQLLGTTSAASQVTVTNLLNRSLTVSGITASGDFAQTNTCGSSLAGGASCVIRITFTPTAKGTRTGKVKISYNAPDSPRVVSLSGIGTVVQLSPKSLSFAARPVGTTSAPQTVTLTNIVSTALTVSGITASGDFAQTNTCGSSVAGGAQCTINVTFKPTATGTRTGALTVSHDGGGSPSKVALSGIGQ